MKIITDIKARIEALKYGRPDAAKELEFWLPQIEKALKDKGAVTNSPKKDDYSLTRQLVEIWSEAMDMRRMVATEKLSKEVAARRKTFSDEEIIHAINNRIEYMKTSDWHNKPENDQHKKNIYLVLRDDDRLQMELNRNIMPSSEAKDTVTVNKMRFE